MLLHLADTCSWVVQYEDVGVGCRVVRQRLLDQSLSLSDLGLSDGHLPLFQSVEA